MDKYPPNNSNVTTWLNYLNYLFTTIFAAECIVKIVALGFELYCSE